MFSAVEVILVASHRWNKPCSWRYWTPGIFFLLILRQYMRKQVWRACGLFPLFLVRFTKRLWLFSYLVAWAFSATIKTTKQLEGTCHDVVSLSIFWFNLVSVCLQLLTYGRRIPFAELFARIDAVDASTIKRVANRFIYDRVGSIFTPILLWYAIMKKKDLTIE